MNLIDQPASMLATSRRWLRSGRTVGFVPTLGNLHEGHLSLLRAAVAECDETVLSIFVNPLQFGAGEDFERYPRTLDADLAAADSVGCEYAFVPSLADFYPPEFATRVRVEGLVDGLCGRSRPGHFEGVATVVARLLGLVLPTRAYFGEKDYQQLRVIARMTEDLGLGCAIVGMPIVREADGLAMSSRNQYLSPAERTAARCLSLALEAGASAASAGAESVVAAARAVVDAEPLARLDYLELVDAETLAPLATLERPGRLCVAAYFGSARLIDNVAVPAERTSMPGGLADRSRR